jgi:hypothetical protein
MAPVSARLLGELHQYLLELQPEVLPKRRWNIGERRAWGRPSTASSAAFATC